MPLVLKTARRAPAGAARAAPTISQCPPSRRVRKFFSGVSLAGEAGDTGLAGRYATALFELADEGKALDQVAGDLKQLDAALGGSDDLRRLVRSPVIGRDDQIRTMDAILDKMKLHELTRRFVGVVGANRRLFALSTIIRAYLAELARRRGEVTANVVTAHKLNDTQNKALRAALKKTLGGKVTIDHRVDPAILGGMVVKVGSRMVDSSLRTLLQKLKFAMKGAN